MREVGISEPFKIYIESGQWYSGKSNNFSMVMFDTLDLSSIIVPISVVEYASGMYYIELTIDILGDFILQLNNSDLFSPFKSLPVKVVSDNLSIISTTIKTLPTLGDIESVVENSYVLNNISEMVNFIYHFTAGSWKLEGSNMVFYELNSSKELARFSLHNSEGDPTSDPAATVERRNV